MPSGESAPGTGTATHRTPTSCSPSSRAWPARRIFASSASRTSGSVMVCGVCAGMPVRASSSRTALSGSWESSALPTPVQWAYTRRPTSVNIRIEWREGTWPTYMTASPSRTARFADSPRASTSPASTGRAHAPSIVPATWPSGMSRAPSAYRRFGSWRM